MPWVRQAPGVGLFSSSTFDTHSFFQWGNPKLCDLCQVHRGEGKINFPWLLAVLAGKFSDVLAHILQRKVTAATILFLGQSRDI